VVTSSLATPLGKKVLSYLIAKSLKAAPPPNPFQIGVAGAVPPPDTAPLVGGPHQYPSVIINPEGDIITLKDNNFHWHNLQTPADIANKQMSEHSSSNGSTFNR
jgi:hypothetical protein